MRKSPVLYLLFGLLLLAAACKREEEVLIPDNIAPPDRTVEDVVVESYITRVYISLLGRKADDNEAAAAKTQLRGGNFSLSARADFVDGLTVGSEYQYRLYDLGRYELLDGADTTSIREQRDVFSLLLTQPQYQAFWAALTIERDRLNDVLSIPGALTSGSIDRFEMHRRFSTNYFFDQINMGTQNFVIAMFQEFLFRFPTDAERIQGERMVDGFSSTSFLESGRNKEDFIRILLSSGDYAEGQVRSVFLRMLYREPSVQEVELLTPSYKDTGDYRALLRNVLSSDEFAGL
jgi:hypothetical protein